MCYARVLGATLPIFLIAGLLGRGKINAKQLDYY